MAPSSARGGNGNHLAYGAHHVALRPAEISLRARVQGIATLSACWRVFEYAVQLYSRSSRAASEATKSTDQKLRAFCKPRSNRQLARDLRRRHGVVRACVGQRRRSIHA